MSADVRHGSNEDVHLGPIQNQEQFDKVASLVKDACRTGKLLIGGTPDEGLFFPITLISEMKNSDALVDTEQFGPVLPIIRYTNVADAIAWANDNPNGLGGPV